MMHNLSLFGTRGSGSGGITGIVIRAVSSPRVRDYAVVLRNVVWPARQKPGARILRAAILAYVLHWLWARYPQLLSNSFLLGWERVCALIPGTNFTEMLTRTWGWHWGQNWTYPRLEDGFDSGYRIQNKDLCIQHYANNGSERLFGEVEVFLMVLTSAGNFQQRKTIRQTWGDRMRETPKARMAFFVGSSENESLNNAVEKENMHYGDIIQTTIIDNKFNIAHKEFSALVWASSHCPDLVHYVKADDDIYIVVDELMAFSKAHRHDVNVMFGPKFSTRCFFPPMYNIALRGQAGMGRFQDWHKSYPFFVAPSWLVQTYLYSRDVPKKLIKAAYEGPFWFGDGDITLNGFLAERAGVERVHVPEFRVPYTATILTRTLFPNWLNKYLYGDAVVISHLLNIGEHITDSQMREIHDFVVKN